MPNSSSYLTTIAYIGLLSAPVLSHAVTYKGVEFPDGAVSFADEVVLYDPTFGGTTGPGAGVQDPSEALGIPDYTEGPGTDYVSLGDGGRIVLRFTDNSLTGSGDDALDLWIFEVGPDVEDTAVDISKNGIDWHSVGEVGGSTSGIDIDFYGWDTSDFFSYIRLTDDTDEGQQGPGGTVGADIDAVGAITSAPPAVPVPAAVWLFGSGLIGLTGIARRKKA